MKSLNKLFDYNYKNVSGLTKELINQYILNYYKNNNENIIVLTSSLYEANNIYKDLQAYTSDVLFFPMDDFLTSVAIATSPDFKVKRLETVETIKQNDKKKHIVITSLMGYLKYLPNIKKDQQLTIDPSPSIISREIILKKIEEFGYKRESIVTTTGEFAIRGFVIDIFPINYEHPIRIEFFGDDIECIKEFDENTQMSIKKIDKAQINAFDEIVDETPSSLADYLNNETIFIIDDNQIKNSYLQLQTQIFEYNISQERQTDTKYMFDIEDIKLKTKFYINTINNIVEKDTKIYNSKELLNFNSNLENLQSFCNKALINKTVIFILKTEKQIETIKNLFPEAQLVLEQNIENNKINIVKGELNRGFEIDNYIYISPYDIENVKNSNIKYKNTLKVGKKIKTFNELEIGDYIVHEIYGIGIYNGLATLKKGDVVKDYIQLSYLDKDKIYVPVENVDKLFKYSNKDGIKPKINKLNSGAWEKKKLELRKKIKDISQELLKLYSERSKIQVETYKDFEEEIVFAMNFPYILTSDQEKCIHEINEDLKSSKPMDRLLCGDVGYGKTEVAFRAMFKTVLNGGQVAYLCPTTILSNQQYKNALERFKDYPIRIELLNRHISPSKTKKIFEDLENGKIDIVIGTHKLLNKAIKYKKLGLLVIDEEQRFGVSHKEKIKEYKNDINVLTLSATPIPRTLKMAMSGMRSLSILDTPPVNRYPIQTYVINENDLIIKDAIYKELSRNGQIYILINNISEINRVVNKINNLAKEARVISAHGQMASEEINSIMERFINYEFDILVCTTIIETGIDISNVNTIIILEADKFGLSQLYQIRGRVGRSDKIAYAYLMYNPSKILTETATKRLNSIKEFTELGSGYKIAMRDLSIRGAGDLLGSEQAGFIETVGLDMFVKMINEEVGKLQGTYVEETTETNNQSMIDINTHIDDSYVQDEEVKIEIHKIISSIQNKEDINRVKTELEDRFGKIDKDIELYMIQKCVEKELKKLNIKNIIKSTNKITISLPKEISDKIDGERLFLQVYNISHKFELGYKNNEIKISIISNNLPKHYLYYIFDLINVINEQII